MEKKKKVQLLEQMNLHKRMTSIKEKIRWCWKIKKAKLIALVMRHLFCNNRLEMTIDIKLNGDK